MKIKIVVATHKSYQMPAEDCYLPLQVGAAGKKGLGYQRDDEGDNISCKNPYYYELTGLYWAWKNLEADYIGLVHYRRYFRGRGKGYDFDRIMKEAEWKRVLKNTEIVLPKKRHYVIETLYSHYAHTHYGEHLDAARRILERMCPEYLEAFDKVMKQRSGHMFNMMVMKQEKLKDYCGWLFPILEKLEDEIDYRQYDDYQARMFGRISELLLNVWLEKNQYSYREKPMITVERIKWGKKVCSFLKAKYGGEKYESSF